MNINLTDCFPEAKDGTRGPLPKQAEFIRLALSSQNPKYISYTGGIGSGKTLVGCIALLSQALMHSGDYLISRLFFPELKTTTYKTFLEICPKELIVEHRVADMQIKVHSANGKTSNIYFRPLEEPDKMRSMNLSGFLIDEASQVSEEAFMLLQGRLRGPGLRKGLLVSNPEGHNYIYRWFLRKDHLKSEVAKNQYHLIQAPSTENVHLPDGYVQSLMESWSEDRIKREIYGSFDSFAGQVFDEFRRDIHVVKPFRIPENWQRHLRIDHGLRNPAAFLSCAISPEGEVYVYREMYEREWLIHELLNGDRRTKKEGFISRNTPEDKYLTAKIDPSTKNRRGATGESDYDEYRRVWPESYPPLQLANNDVQVGIDRVKSYFKVNPKFNRPLLYIFDTCVNLLEEITTYRYPDLRPNEVGKKAENEKPIKVNDHALDALRYLIIDLPEPYQLLKPEEDLYKLPAAQRMLREELKKIKNPPAKDPFDGMF